MRYKVFAFIVFVLLFKHSLFTQNIKSKIIDSSTNKAVSGAHISSISKPEIGTVSNEDGSFILPVKLKNDTILISHINYTSKKVLLSDGILIKLDASENLLQEVVVTPMEVNKIMDKVFDNLERNHELEGVTYQLFYRSINYSKDSTLNFVEEHQGLIHQNKRNNSKFKLENSRIKAFSKKGKKELKDYRLIQFGMIQSDNLFKYQEDYLHHRKSKDYYYTLEDVLDFKGRKVFRINFDTDESTYYKSGYLLIDKQTYAIVRNVLDASDYKEVNFTYNSGKWYLSHSYSILRRKDYIQESITNYILSEEPYENSEFNSSTMLMPEKIGSRIEDYNDDYWTLPNIIPLPDWVKNKLRSE